MAAKAGTEPKGRGASKPAPALSVIEGGPAADAPHLTGDEVKEAHYRQMMAEHRGLDADLQVLRDAVKAKNKLRTVVRGKLKAAGYFLSNVDIILDDTSKTRNLKDQQGREDQLREMREWEALPVARTGEQIKLWEKLEPTAKDEIWATQDGYNAGIIDGECKPPATLAPILHPTWTKAWHDGQERRKWALAQEGVVDRDLKRGEEFRPAPVDHSADPGSAFDGDSSDTPATAIARHFAGDTAPDGCETCGFDGSKLAADVNECPDCGAEYEPADAAEAVH